MSDPEHDVTLPAGTSSAHPVSPTSVESLRAVLTEAFDSSLAGWSVPADVTGAPTVGPAVGTVIADDGLSVTRTATSSEGRLVLHETTSGLDAPRGRAAGRRTTIALTGSTVYGERFWLGATSYDGAPVAAIELEGDLPAFVAPALGRVLSALRR